MTQDLITIAITCYNAQDTITRAIQSALAQDYPNTEIIIIDDASTDQSVAAIHAIIDHHPNVQLIKHDKNQGVAAARQTLLTHAKGDFIAFFDDDDQSLPSRLTVQHARITDYEQNTNTQIIACYASGRREYANGYHVDLNAIGSQNPIPHGKDVAARLLFFGGDKNMFFGTGTPTCSLMARTQILRNAGGFDPNFRRVEDVDLAIRLALMGAHFIGCPQTLFVQHATSAPDKAPEKNRDAEIQLAHKHKSYLKSVHRYYYACNWPLLRYYHFTGQYGAMLWVLIKLTLRHPVKTLSHFLTTAPRRFFHERKMKKDKKSCIS